MSRKAKAVRLKTEVLTPEGKVIEAITKLISAIFRSPQKMGAGSKLQTYWRKTGRYR